MAYTKAQREKFIELVRKYANATRLDDAGKELEKRIAAMSKSPQGMNELAQLITENLEDEMQEYDLRPLLFETKPRQLLETVEYKRKGKFRAYRTTRGGYVPKSQIFQDTVRAQPEEFSVRPACHLLQLETGRISSVNELIQGAKDALITEYNRYFYATLDTVNADDATGNFRAQVTGQVDKATLDKMLHSASAKGGQVSIVGTHTSLAPILDFDGFTDTQKDEIMRTGKLGVYRGANLVKLEEFTDADDVEVIKHDTIFIVTRKAGYVDDFGEVRSREIIDAEHDEFSILMRKEWGFTVLYPEYVRVIKIV